MPPRFPRRTLSFFATILIIAAAPPSASADTITRHHVYRGRLVRPMATGGVPLQPFSLYEKSAVSSPSMNVAYYAPHAIPRPTRVEPEEDFSSTPETTSDGSQPTVSGHRAVLRHGIAYAPSDAPARVKSAIWAVNTIRSKPYHWGGGHGSFSDSGYDCSGTVSFALHYAGALNQPLPSSDLLRFGERGRGQWITIYSRHGHTFAMIAGLRLDTTDLRYGSDVGPRWHTDGRDTWGFEARHPVGL